MMTESPPVSIHPPAIGISTVPAYARSIASRSSTEIKLLQQRLNLLLVMTIFLCPFVMARIPFSSSYPVLQDGHFHFKVLALKETPGKRGIVKPFTVRPHATADMKLCLLQRLRALRGHPRLAFLPYYSQFFVKSNYIN
ncbi:hypothetical protein G6F42_015783 [Rhizopus arrhizus]|nr:hypothetical protein G6F42_015783 [Rhizopus arrhizus]